ncbi:hypothetical protein BH11PAT2_BH11PAT2_03550 [soil metagenome]
MTKANSSGVSVWFEGTITNLDTPNNLTRIETNLGVMLADLTDTWFPRVKPGDKVECEEGGGYLRNGQWISYPDSTFTINGFLYRQEDYAK